MSSYWIVTIVWLIVYYIMSRNIWVGLVCGGGGLEWCGVGNINFPNENGLVWV